MAEWKLLTLSDGAGSRWVNLDRVAYIFEVKDATVLGTYTNLQFDHDFSLQVKEVASKIVRHQ
jgi:hypothetical protein